MRWNDLLVWSVRFLDFAYFIKRISQKMQTQKLSFLLLLFTVCSLTACQQNADREETVNDRPPNIIYILADDLGYGDVGYNGQEKFATPNIDRLARQGLVFTQHYAGNTVCAPSRSCLMTGLHTGHTPVRGNKEIQPEGQHPLPDTILTVAKLLQQQGYVTGAFGKWGLGFPGSAGDPVNQGFNRFFGYNCQRLGHHYYPYYLWDNETKVELTENQGQQTGTYAPELIHEKTLAFIEDHKEQPFFLYVPSIIPHAELFAPEEYMERFRGKFPPETVYQGVDEGENYRLGPYGTQEEPHAAFAAMVTLLDDQVGEIVAKVKELGLEENTLIIFTSDNGPHQEGGADPDYFNSNGPLKGYKRDLYEGGIRVPTVAYWPSTVKAGQTDHISAFWDFLPTAAELSGAGIPAGLDGISYLPTLTGKGTQKQHDYLYWEFHERGGRVAIRKGKWKGVRYDVLKNPDSPLELYDLSQDIGEEHNVADQHPGIAAELDSLLRQARTPSDVFTFSSGTFLNVK